jgi:hypothetical protein
MSSSYSKKEEMGCLVDLEVIVPEICGKLVIVSNSLFLSICFDVTVVVLLELV